jgi:competence protein ComEA
LAPNRHGAVNHLQLVSRDDGAVPFAVSRSTVLVGVCLALVVLAVLGQRLAHAGAASETQPAPIPLEHVAEAPARAILVVHVAGEVRRPGLYRLRDGARIADAVRRSGGALRGADLTAVNLAAPLVDGIQILVPAKATSSPSSGSADTGFPTGPVSLSSATVEELDVLPGVGPITAQKIVDYRTEHGPFAAVDDLDAVPGIGPTRIEQLRDLVTP